MSNDMIALKGDKLPAHLRAKEKVENKFAAAQSSGGYPVVSIKGKVFHLQRGDERTLIAKPDDAEEPARALEVVILDTNPNKSKVYYAGGYEEGSKDAPDCYSNDGVAPAADAEDPQSKKCATCPHNQWGSRITENGNKGKSCADSMRLAVAPAGQLNDPMLLRVPAASLKVLGQYGSQLAKRGVAPEHVVTRVGFDYNVAYPALTFKAMGFIDEHQLAEMEEVMVSEKETIDNITGVSGAPSTAAEKDLPEEPEAPKAKKDVAKAFGSPSEGPEENETSAKDKKDKKAKKDKKKKKALEQQAAEDGTLAESQDGSAEQDVVDKKEPDAKSAEDYDSIEDALDNLDFDD